MYSFKSLKWFGCLNVERLLYGLGIVDIEVRIGFVIVEGL